MYFPRQAYFEAINGEEKKKKKKGRGAPSALGGKVFETSVESTALP